MNFYHLKYFYDSARLKSITKAAALNRVGQPAITKAIQKLEIDLNSDLIRHERNRFELSERGELVFEHCEKIFGVTSELRDRIKAEIEPQGEVRFACPSSMAESAFLANAIHKITQQYPLIEIKLMLGRTDLIRDWVRDGLADFGIVVDNLDIANYDCETIAKGFFRLIKSPNYKRDWHEDGVMTVEKKSEKQKLKHLYEQHYNRELKTKLEIGSWGVIKKFVQAEIAVGFVPDYMIEEDLRAKKVVLVDPKRLSVPYEIKVIRVKDRYLNSRTKLVLDEIRRCSK